MDKLDKLNNERDDLTKTLHGSTPEIMVEWMIGYHGLSEDSRGTVESNLKDAFRAERVRGQLTPSQIDKHIHFDVEVKLFGWTILRIKSREE